MLIKDYITGKEIPNVGAEENRQAVAKYLVEAKGFLKSDLEIDAPLEIDIRGETYRATVDIVVTINGRCLMAFKCAAGSIGSREKEILSAAKLLENYQIPLAVVSDGRKATVLDTISGKPLGEGLEAIPSKAEIEDRFQAEDFRPVPDNRLEQVKLVFRSYDSMNVNITR
ncbi:MAG: type I restriction enzyme HsdR N-terminal domain-containing protein [Desulfobacterales bacterium]|nr:type I restriction enzyme HsdR N-terminal domain-containing protein [Desulfobacterales bacterium]